MSQEIIEAVREIERDKGIEEGALVAALEDALLAAYKKTPGASRHAVVELDRGEGDFRVFSIELPPDTDGELMATLPMALIHQHHGLTGEPADEALARRIAVASISSPMMPSFIGTRIRRNVTAGSTRRSAGASTCSIRPSPRVWRTTA